LSQPEFRDVDKVRNLLMVLEDENRVSEVLSAPGDVDRTAIQIGEEIKVRELSDCSVVSATYRLSGEVIGRVGVIGPKRMEYARVVAMVNAITQQLEEAAQRNLS
jgi:heat-inducible transcriptional repressor